MIKFLIINYINIIYLLSLLFLFLLIIINIHINNDSNEFANILINTPLNFYIHIHKLLRYDTRHEMRPCRLTMKNNL